MRMSKSAPSQSDAANQSAQPSVYIFYHYLPPDEVVSAVHFGELSAGLVRLGWRVAGFASIWSCRDASRRFPRQEQWQGVELHRIWRPRFNQARTLGRLLNSFAMTLSWSMLALRPNPPDVVLIGTDPILSLVAGIFWKLVRPRTRIVHWCFDLYPEAAIADGLLSPSGMAARVCRRLMSAAYSACSLIVDIGPCMRGLLDKYPSAARRITLVPWALDEPEAPLEAAVDERERIFSSVGHAMLYSGTFGHAHSYASILQLAQIFADTDIRIAFSVQGNRLAELHRAAQPLGDLIRFVPFASPEKLRERLAAADIHIVSLEPAWTGTVIPSKFFGSLAAGRPILFCGSRGSSIARWILQFDIGWVLEADNIAQIASSILAYAASPDAQATMRQRCFDAYRQHFSRAVQIQSWDCALRSILPASTMACQPCAAPSSDHVAERKR